MRDFANHVTHVANQNSNGITNLQLHKVMYFALGNYINENGIDDLTRNIYDEPFEAWPYGPVVRTEYFRHRHFGRYNINFEGVNFEQYETLNDYILNALNTSITELVEESHLHDTWLTNRKAILRHELVEYSLEDIENDFSAGV